MTKLCVNMDYLVVYVSNGGHVYNIPVDLYTYHKQCQNNNVRTNCPVMAH